MKTKSLLALGALCLMLPAAGAAQGLPEFLEAGAAVGGEAKPAAVQTAVSTEGELELALSADAARMEEGQAVTLTIAAQNPLSREVQVTFDLALPERIACAQETAWEAVLAPVGSGEGGVAAPSVTTFTRTLTLLPGGGSERAEIACEMGMGTRFYRAKQPLDLCVPDVTVNAAMIGGEDGRLEPGETFAWQIEVDNAGTAAKDVELALVLPDGVTPVGETAPGMTLEGRRMTGVVRAEAAQAGDDGLTASEMVIELPMQVDEDALSGDADATRLVAGTLYADGVRVPLPRIQVCGAKISAHLSAESDALEPGEETTLRVFVLNEGLADAHVRLACALPEGLELVQEDEQQRERTPASAAFPDDSGTLPGPDAAPAMTFAAAEDAMTYENGTVVLSWQMDGAQEGESGVTANTDVFDIRVRALEAQDHLRERMVGASLAYSVNGGEMQFGQALALRVHTPSFLGVSKEDWNAIFWACLLMMITVSCLYAAVSAGSAKETYSCE